MGFDEKIEVRCLACERCYNGMDSLITSLSFASAAHAAATGNGEGNLMLETLLILIVAQLTWHIKPHYRSKDLFVVEISLFHFDVYLLISKVEEGLAYLVNILPHIWRIHRLCYEQFRLNVTTHGDYPCNRHPPLLYCFVAKNPILTPVTNACPCRDTRHETTTKLF